jgi:hypothetical protein
MARENMVGVVVGEGGEMEGERSTNDKVERGAVVAQDGEVAVGLLAHRVDDQRPLPAQALCR